MVRVIWPFKAHKTSDRGTTVGTKIFRGKMLCASEIGLYYPVVVRVKDYTQGNTRELLYNVNMCMLYSHQTIACILSDFCSVTCLRECSVRAVNQFYLHFGS